MVFAFALTASSAGALFFGFGRGLARTTRSLLGCPCVWGPCGAWAAENYSDYSALLKFIEKYITVIAAHFLPPKNFFGIVRASEHFQQRPYRAWATDERRLRACRAAVETSGGAPRNFPHSAPTRHPAAATGVAVRVGHPGRKWRGIYSAYS